MPLSFRMSGAGVSTDLRLEFRRRVTSVLRSALHEAFEEGLTFIKPKIIERTPMDHGDLRDSFEHEIQISDWGVRMKLEFTDYKAQWVHEMPRTYNFTTPGTGPKFLQGPVDEYGPEMGTVIIVSLRQSLGT